MKKIVTYHNNFVRSLRKTAHITLPFALFVLGAAVLYSAPPATKYMPGETLDPNCGPGDLNCSVEIGSSLWEQDGLDIYYNTGNVGLGASAYLNWGSPFGSGGYGLRDSAGTLEFKDSAGSWTAFNSLGGGGGGSLWSLHANGEDIYRNLGNVGINTTEPEYQFESTSNTVAGRFRGIAGVMPDAWDFETTNRNGDYQLSLGVPGSDCEIGGVTFNTDGTKMFIAGHCYLSFAAYNNLDAGNPNNRLAYVGAGSPDSPLSVHEYDLSTPWDINTAVDNGLSYDPYDDLGRDPDDVIFTPDGLTMFVLVPEIDFPTSGASIVEYSLASPWSMAPGNVTYVQERVLDGGPPLLRSVPISYNFQFNDDGTQLFLSGYMDLGFSFANLWMYDLTTAYDITTIDEASPVLLDAFPYGPTDTYFNGAFTFDPSGDKLFLVYQDFSEEYYVINKFDLATPWDINFGAGNPSATETYSLLDTDALDGYTNLEIRPDGAGFYITYSRLALGPGVRVGGVYQHVLIPGTEGGNVIVDGDLGVGTVSPTSKLTVVGNSDFNGDVTVTGNINLSDTSLEVALGSLSGRFIVAEDSSGIILTGTGSRMFFDPAMSAFRAGQAVGTGWDSSNVGEWSTAFGIGTIASGARSTAFGGGTTASGGHSVAFGDGAEATGSISTAFGGNTLASGFLSTAFGAETEASASFSTAFGRQTEASGDYSTVFGRYTAADGDYSTAFGWYSEATGTAGTAFGYQTQAIGSTSTAFGSLTEASGSTSTAFGTYSIASGDTSTAFGYVTEASGENSTAFGGNTEASGYASFASGYNTLATGNYATSLGYNTTAQAFASVVLGRDNIVSGNLTTWIESDPLFVIGNGDSAGTPSNALTVLKNGNVGIGSIAPEHALDVAGDINFTGNLYKNGVLFSGASGTNTALWTLNSQGNAIYNNGGKVGINTLDPEYQLDVVSDTVAARFRSTSAPWDLTTLSFDALYETHPASGCFVGGGEFSPDGTKVFIVEDCDGPGGEQEIQKHTLGTAWDITTATDSGSFLDLAVDLSDDVVDISFNSAGTKMFALTFDSANERAEVHQYGLLTPWDVDTAVYSKSQFLESALETMESVSNVGFSTDGSKLFIMAAMEDLTIPFFEANAHIVEYTLSTPWDVAVLSETDSEAFSDYSAPIISAPLLFTFSSDGEKLFVGSIDVNAGDMSYETIIREYNLSTPWSLNSFTLGTEATIESGLNVGLSTPYTAFYFRSDGLRGYATQFGSGGAVDGGINQYSLSDPFKISGGSVIVDGDLAVGNTSPVYKLHVTTLGSGSVAGFTNSNGTCTIDPNTSSLSCASDSRLKTEVLSIKGQTDTGSSLSRLSQLNPVSYRWNNEEGTGAPMRYGLIAQEVQEVFPELVSTGPFLDPNDPSKGNTLSVSYGGFTPFIIDAISELNDRVDFISSLSLDSSESSIEIGGSLPEIIVRSLKNSIVTAREFIADRIRTRELCIEDDEGETCVDRNTLDSLLRGEKVNHTDDSVNETPDTEEDLLDEGDEDFEEVEDPDSTEDREGKDTPADDGEEHEGVEDEGSSDSQQNESLKTEEETNE